MARTKSGMQFDIVVYQSRYFEGVKALWRESFPDHDHWRAPEFVIRAKMAIQPDLFLVAVNGNHVIGTTMAGYDGHRGWLYTVAVLRPYQRVGVGSALIRDAEERLVALGCPKINLQVLSINTVTSAFYQKLGYVTEERVSMGKPIGAFAKEGSP